MKTIHLGHKESVLSPIAAVKSPEGEKTQKQTVHYPSFHIHGDGKDYEDLHKLPESGTMHVKYHVHSRSRGKSEDGKTEHHSVELKVHKILGAEADKADPSGEEALDSLAKDVKNSKAGKKPASYVGENVGMNTP